MGAGVIAAELPFYGGGEESAATATEVGGFDGLDDLLGGELL